MKGNSHPVNDTILQSTNGAFGAELPLVSVIITTRNRPRQLIDAVRSVLANSVRPLELLVIDQSDGLDTRTLLESHFGDDARVRYIAHGARGISHGRNAGVAHARADIIAITDDDCLVPPTWIAEFLADFARHPDVMLICGAVDAPPHDYRSLIIPVELLAERRVERGLRGHAARLEGIGAHMVFKRALVNAIGGFDPHFGAGGARKCSEDYELHYRALCAGHAVLIEPDITVMHMGMRPIRDAWALWQRDALGNGALAARMVHDGHWLAAWRFWWWNVGRVLAMAFFRTISFQYPTGTRMAFWMIWHSMRGFAAEWRAPGETVQARVSMPRAADGLVALEEVM